MMLFCPNCSNLLLLRDGERGIQQFFCQGCPYVFDVEQSFSAKVELKRKRVDDILGGAEAWKNVDSTDVVCPKCENPRAYYMQIQIRSADEPSSIFYKCCRLECGHQWREG